VKAGEHLGAIARRYGFANYSPIWEHPNNAGLKAERGDPHVLAPGDELFIPDHTELVFSRTTDASYDFRVNLDMLTLKLRLLDEDGEPRKNAKVTVRVEGPESSGASSTEEQELTTDDDGNLSFEVASSVVSGTIVVDGMEYPLSIGGLDPIETESGVAQRLANLGYLELSDDDLDPELLRLAIQDFQADNDLETSGERRDVEDKLAEVYGA
jgi:hypothetical protein